MKTRSAFVFAVVVSACSSQPSQVSKGPEASRKLIADQSHGNDDDSLCVSRCAGTKIALAGSMNGNQRVLPGDVISVGFSVNIPGNHDYATIVMNGIAAGFGVRCANGTVAPISLPFDAQTIRIAANDGGWVPAGETTYQASVAMPANLCGGAGGSAPDGASFNAMLYSDTRSPIHLRFHYADNGKGGGWSGDTSFTTPACHCGSGRNGFAWEPPVVSSWDATPGLRTDISPVVRIDQVDSTQNDSVLATVATFTLSGACPGPNPPPPSALLGGPQVPFPASPPAGSPAPLCGKLKLNGNPNDQNASYEADWDTKAQTLLAAPATYRARVLVDGWQLGYADTQLDLTNAQFKAVDTQDFVPLMDGSKLQLIFRVDTPAIDYDNDGVRDSLDNCWNVPNGAAQAGVPGVGNQNDSDHDGIGDACDECPLDASNDSDHDGRCANFSATCLNNGWLTQSWLSGLPHFRGAITDVNGVTLATQVTAGDDVCPNVYDLAQNPQACSAPAQAVGASGLVAVADPASPIAGAQVTFPAGSVPAGTTAAIEQLQPADLPFLPAAPAGPIVDFESSAPPASPVSIAVPYDFQRVADPGLLVVYHYDTAHGLYEVLAPDSLDEVNHLVFTHANTLSPFFASASAPLLVTLPSGSFNNSGHITLDLNAGQLSNNPPNGYLVTLKGQVGIPQGAATQQLTIANLSFASAPGSSVVTGAPGTLSSGSVSANCDASLGTASCYLFTVSLAVNGSLNQDLELLAQPLDASGNKLGAPVRDDLYLNVGNYPNAPSWNNGSPSQGQSGAVSLAWSQPSGAVPANSFEVWRSNLLNGTYTKLTTTNSPSYSDSGLPGGAIYYYQAFAIDTLAQYGCSSANPCRGLGSNVLTGSTAITAVNDLHQTALSGTSLSMAWTPVAGNSVSAYQILSGTQAGGPYAWNGAQVASTVGTYTYNGLTPGTIYSFVVRPKLNGLGTQVLSNELLIGTTPAAPTGLTATAAGTGVDLSWTAPAGTGIQQYRIYRSTAAGQETLLTTVYAPATSFHDVPPAGQTYYYVVDAVTLGTSHSALSSEASAKVVALGAQLTSVQPASAMPGTYLTIAGQGLTPGMIAHLRKGSVEVTAQLTSSYQFLLPSLAAGTYDLFVVDTRGIASSILAFTVLAPGNTVIANSATVSDQSLDGTCPDIQSGTVLTLSGAHQLACLTVRAGGTLTYPAQDPNGLTLTMGGALQIEAGGVIQASLLGAPPDMTYANGTFTSAGASGAGGSYGGVGAGGGPNAVYGDPRAPAEPGTGGNSADRTDPNNPASGGGLVRIAAGSANIDGQIIADGGGDHFYVSGGSGGGISLTLSGAFSGAGSLSARGGPAPYFWYWNGGGGGGGRIAVTGYTQSTFTGDIAASGSNYYWWTPSGGAGTVYLRGASESGTLVLDNRGYGNGIATPLSGSFATILGRNTVSVEGSFSAATVAVDPGANLTIPADVYLSTSLQLSGTLIVQGTLETATLANAAAAPGAILENQGSLQLDSDSLQLPAGLTLRNDGELHGPHRAANEIGSANISGTLTASSVQTLSLTVDGALSVSGSIDATGLGLPGSPNGQTPAVGYGGATGASNASGGSYGGQGGGSAAPATYGDARNPQEPGSGGAGWYGNSGGAGGGVLLLRAASLQVNGSIGSDGVSMPYYGGGGSGGAVNIALSGALSGSGSIHATGGAAGNSSPTYAGGGGRVAVSGYSGTFNGTMTAHSGGGYWTAWAGTVVLAPQSGPETLVLDGKLVEVSGVQFSEIQIDANTNATFDGSVTADSVSVAGTLRNNGSLGADVSFGSGASLDNEGSLQLASLSLPAGTTLTNEGDISVQTGSASIAGTLIDDGTFDSLDSLTVLSGGVVTHSSGNPAGLSLQLSGALDVQGGGRIDASGQGAPGGSIWDGTQFTGTGAADGPSGGSYGGLGGGPSPNATYGDVRMTAQPGSGGSWNGISESSGPGAGGGVIQITAASINVDGQILADGTGFKFYTGGGSGGGIQLQTSALSGAGVIAARGGGAAHVWISPSGAGGGGRIAITGYAQSSFTGLVTASGGLSSAGAGGPGGPGTVFLQSASEANGEVLLDNGSAGSGIAVSVSGIFDAVRVGNVATLSTDSVLTAPLALSGGGTLINYGTIHTNDLNPGSLAAGTTLVNRGTLTIASDSIELAGTLSNAGDLHGANPGSIGAIVIDSGGVLTHEQGYEPGLSLTIGTLDVQQGGAVDVTGKGYAGASFGSPAMTWSASGGTSSGASTNGSGGSYGGLGGGPSPNVAYGDPNAPQELGSGGGNIGNYFYGGAGGGRIDLTVATLSLDGSLIADGGGGQVYYGGGGSGGAIRVVAQECAGGGNIHANGGVAADYSHGGGGGGRVRLTCVDGGLLSSISVAGNNGPDGGALGTAGSIVMTLAAPVLTASAPGSISWTAVPGANDYTLSRATTSGGPYSALLSTSALSYTDTDTVAGDTYYYVVTAASSYGVSPYSAEASISLPPPAPIDPCGTTITSSVTLNSDLNCPYNGIIIGADDVTLDCAGHTINFYTSYGPGCYFGNGCVYQGWGAYLGVSVNAIVALAGGNGNQYQAASSSYTRFTIQNCNIAGPNLGSDFAISVANANAGTIANNTTAASNAAIVVNGSSGLVISGNTITPLYGVSSGITAYSSSSLTLANNHITATNNGIVLQQTSGCSLTGNDIEFPSQSGDALLLSFASGNVASNNTFAGATVGAYEQQSNNNTFGNNLFESNGTAALISQGPNNPNCTRFPTLPGCQPVVSTGNLFHQNEFLGNSLDVSNPGSATGNTFFGNDFYAGVISDAFSAYAGNYYSGLSPPAQEHSRSPVP